MTELVPPHGSATLKPLLLTGDEKQTELERATNLKSIPLTTREVSDVFMLGMGAYTPLDGFMGEADWRGVCENMKLASGVFWPIPVTLSASEDVAASIEVGEDVALCDGESGEILAILTVSEKYSIDKQLECQTVYKTTDEAHPGVQKVLSQEAVNLGGSVKALSEGEYPEKYAGLYLLSLIHI